MKILIISQERRYKNIVNELRKNNKIDYVFISDQLRVDNGDYHVPRFMGFNRGFKLLACLLTTYLLLTKRYDICMTDYKCILIPTIFPIVRELASVGTTSFIYDIRTIPVDYGENVEKKVEKQFYRSLRFANRFYQGITVITDEMMNYLQCKYISFKKPVGIWESGVDTLKFRPLNMNLNLKRGIGFKDDDFVCFYHGSISRKRGVIELVESYQSIISSDNRIKLLLLGGCYNCDYIEELVAKHNLGDFIKIYDWVDYDQVPEFISIADLCIVPLPDIDWWRVSSPLKLMEYIACGKNILLTEMVAHTNVLGRNNNFFWIHEATSESFAEGILASYRLHQIDPHIYYEKGIIGHNLFVDKISWEQRSLSLQNFFSNFVED